MKTLPAEFRRRVIALADDGMTTGEIAEVLGAGAIWVRSIEALRKSGASIERESRADKRTSPNAKAAASASKSRPGPAPAG